MVSRQGFSTNENTAVSAWYQFGFGIHKRFFTILEHFHLELVAVHLFFENPEYVVVIGICKFVS